MSSARPSRRSTERQPVEIRSVRSARVLDPLVPLGRDLGRKAVEPAEELLDEASDLRHALRDGLTSTRTAS